MIVHANKGKLCSSETFFQSGSPDLMCCSCMGHTAVIALHSIFGYSHLQQVLMDFSAEIRVYANRA